MLPPRPRAPLRTSWLLAALLAVLSGSAAAQATPRAMDGVRVGVALGGAGLMGLTVEWIGEDLRGVEAMLATWGFRDVSLAITGRHYFGGGYVRPVVGAGLWLSHSFAEGGSGTALLVRAPLGFDWRATGEQFLGVSVVVNRMLWLVRGSPEAEDLPPEGRLVPLPELAWRWRP